MSLGNKNIMAKNIRRLMELKGVNQTELCNALGFKFMTVSDWVNAKTYPRIDKIEMMANYFGVAKAELVEDESAGFYLRSETAAIAEDIRSSKELSMLFDAARDARPEDLKQAHDLLLFLKQREQGKN